MQSKAKTVREYLASLPDDRKQALETVRKVILANLDGGFEEVMQYGMIGYCVPHRIFPAGYHCDPEQPLPFACLASQKNYMSLYMMSVYGGGTEEQWMRAAWAKAGKKLDMGKSCIRFKNLEDLPLAVVGEAFRRVTAEKYIEHYVTTLGAPRAKPAAKPAASKTAKKPATRVRAVER